MDILPILAGLILAYVAFMLVGYFLARLIFPSLDVEDERKRKKNGNGTLGDAPRH